MASLFLSAGQDVRIWDANTLKVMSTVKMTFASITSAIWSPKGTAVAIVGAKSDSSVSSVFIADVAGRGILTPPRELLFESKSSSLKSSRSSGSARAGKSGKSVIAFGNRSQMLACGGRDGQIDVVELKNSTVSRTFAAGRSSVTAITFSADDAFIISGDADGNINFQSSDGTENPTVVPTEFQAVLVFRLFPSDSGHICCGHKSGVVSILDSHKMQLIHAFQPAHLAACLSIDFNPANPALIASVGMDNQMLFFDVQKMRKFTKIPADSSLWSVAFVQNGAKVLCGSSTGKILIFDASRSFALQTEILVHTTPVVSLALQPDPKKARSTSSVTPLLVSGTSLLQAPQSAVRIVNSTPLGIVPSKSRTHGQSKSDLTSVASESALKAPTSPERQRPGVLHAPFSARSVGMKSEVTKNGGGDYERHTSPLVPANLHFALGEKDVEEKTLSPKSQKTNGVSDHVSFDGPSGSGDGDLVLSLTKNFQEVMMENRKNLEEVIVENRKNFQEAVMENRKDAQEVMMENRINCLDVRDVIHDYGLPAQRRLEDMEEKLAKVDSDNQRNYQLLETVLAELQAIRRRLPVYLLDGQG